MLKKLQINPIFVGNTTLIMTQSVYCTRPKAKRDTFIANKYKVNDLKYT